MEMDFCVVFCDEGKFVLNIDFIMALKPDGLFVYETTKQDSI